MIYSKYGSTDVDVSAIGFGGMRFDSKADLDRCAELVKSAYDVGINYFDTAPAYPRSEEIFGIALKEMQKTRGTKPFYIATKSAKANPADVRRDIETSLKKLNLDYIDFYHLWCIITVEEYKTRRANGVLAEFEKLKSEGLIKHICISTHMTGADVEDVLKDYPFEGVLLGYSAMNFPYRDQGLQAASDLNRGLVVMNPLGGGLIPQNPERFGFLKTKENQTVTQAALHFLINDKRINVALVGFSNHDHLNEAVQAIETFAPIPDSRIQKIRDSLSDSLNEMCTSCCYCDKCPQKIPVPKLMDAYNHYMLSGKPQDAIDRLRWHWSIPPESNLLRICTECGRCEIDCTQKLPIIERIKELCAQADKYLTEQNEKKKNES